MLKQLVNFLQALTKLISAQTRLAALEAKLAIHSILPLCISLSVLCMAIFSAWILILISCAMIVYYYSENYLLALLGSFAINTILIIVGISLIRHYALQMSFKNTRAYAKKSLENLKLNENTKLTTEDQSS